MTAYAAFHQHVTHDVAAQDRLAGLDMPDAFVTTALDIAAEAGITLTADDLRAANQPDPLGLARGDAMSPPEAHWPPLPWLPTRVVATATGPAVDWAHFAGRVLTEPFYEDSIRRAVSRPFNRLFQHRTAVQHFIANADHASSLAPNGFVFHMSRCGSTLVAQAYAALADTIVVSEAPALDGIVQLAGRGAPTPVAIAALQAVVAALGRRRAGTERRYVLKLDSWHILSLPLFRAAFPDVPWVFLYRDPVEVLVSQMRMRGMQTIPELMPPGLYDIGDIDGVGVEDICARILANICDAAVAGADGKALIMPYDQLAAAVPGAIARHFGLALGDADRAAIARSMRRDAKEPIADFAPDTTAKQAEATPQVHAASALLRDSYRRLRALSPSAPR